MQHKTGGNQIHGVGLDFHLMKTQSITMEMFWIAKLMPFSTNMREKRNK